MIKHLRWMIRGAVVVTVILGVLGACPSWLFGGKTATVAMMRAGLLALFGTMVGTIPLVISLCFNKAVMCRFWIYSANTRIVTAILGSLILHLMGREITLVFLLWLKAFYAALLVWEVWAMRRLVEEKANEENTGNENLGQRSSLPGIDINLSIQ
ncbi:MAG: hypothetical protein JW936_05550 [Sedimentisphaerales bacterium]|nr:hypothetical protein [Sedimentisphaerales bacterium]